MRLYRALPPEHRGGGFPVALEAVADLLCCTTRNAVFLLRKWEANGWISWKPGSGRNHRSTLRLLAPPENVLFEQAQKLFGEQKADRAFALLADDRAAEALFASWLSQRMGYRVQPAEHGQTQRESLHFPFYRSLQTVDPAFAVRQTEYHFIRQLFDTLLLPGTAGEARPHLCHAWEKNDSHTRWTFYLRKGVRFHDSRSFTSEDAVRTLKRLVDPRLGSPHRHLYRNLGAIEPDGPYRLSIETHGPEPLLAEILAMPSSSIVSAVSKDSAAPAGTGPYRLIRSDRNGAVLEAFDSYFLGRPHLDEVAMWVLPEPANSGESAEPRIRFVPFASDAADTAAAPAEPADREPERIRVRERLELKYLVFNMRGAGPQRSRSFRSAVARTIASADIAGELGANRAAAEEWRTSRENGAGSNSAAFRLPEAAGAAEDGCSTGETPLRLRSYEMPLHLEDMRWIAGRLGQDGIGCAPAALAFERWTEFAEPADLLLGSLVLHPSSELSELALFAESSSALRACLTDGQRDAVDAEIAGLRSDPEPAARRGRLDRILAELRERFLWIPLYTTFQRTGYDARLENMRLDPYAFPEYRDLWMRK
ncbi:ABC transporter substrate-binding protein [Saccharibacillus sp. CPCC 101409]|uniref:ABC transporter substrate-binding protein n=1 Tax=Saccharibacillus sp. CPCC 101409 TaxID=3058041 RepID=UPI002673FEAD|nr:ABC transporter substrate-binding protein [Saccharibacillus sp. CPCC 101409]MDO3408717.1 ABC transporter substrate-binding protein [Saccharibacillus sp. CPCC 101409]